MNFNNKGFSLVEIIISMLFLSASGYLIMQAGSIQKTKNENTSIKEKTIDLTNESLQSFQRAFFQTKDTLNKRTIGVCSLIKKDLYAKPPVGPIYINLQKLSSLLTSNHLKNYLPMWTQVSSPECKNEFSVCFELDKKNELAKAFLSMNPKLKLEVVPVFMNPVKGGIFSTISGKFLTENIDVKSVGFKFSSKIEMIKDKKVKIQKLDTFEWVGLAGYCESEGYKLSFSGMEVVDGSNVIFNRGGFNTNKNPPIDISFRKIVAQAGKYEVDGKYVFTDNSKSIETSCREVSYRCRNQASNSREYEDLSVVADIQYQSPNYLTPATSVNVNISYEIKNGDSLIGLPVNKFFGLDKNCATSKDASGNVDCVKDNKINVNFNANHVISVAMWDAGSTTRSNQLCRKICDKSTDYNLPSGNDSSKRWGGELGIEYVGLGKESYRVSDGIGCTACYMKNCDQFGIGTFGPMNQMPAQPLDAQIPECAINESDDVLYNSLPFKEISNTALSDSSQCISAKLMNDQLVYSAEPCNSSKPVMCFAFGQFLLARDIGTSSSTLSKVSYDKAAERCFTIGREITNKTRLDSFVENQTLLPVVGSNYDFYNLALQGMFLAPQTISDINLYKEWSGKQGIAPGTSFWVALKSSGNSVASSRIPILPSIIDNQNHALYFNGSKKLTYVNFPKKFPISVENGVGVAVHNLKYKGIRFLDAEKPFGPEELKFICRKRSFPFSLFLSNGKSAKVENGSSICANEDGVFSPPLTSYEWIKSLTLVAPISTKHSFPEVNLNPLSLFDMAWIAIESANGKDEKGIDWLPYPANSNLNKNFLSTQIYSPNSTDSTFLLNENGFYFDSSAKISNSDKNIESDFIDSPIILNNGNKLKISIDNRMFEVVIPGASASVTELKNEITKMIPSLEVEINDKTGNKEKIILQSSSDIIIFETPLSQKLGFETSPYKNVKILCIESNNRIVAKSLSTGCGNARRVSMKEIRSTSFKVLWSLYGFDKSQGYYAFE